MAKIPVAGTKPEAQDFVEAFEGKNSVMVHGSSSNKWRERVRELVFPIKFDRHGTHFFDADGKMVAQVRGWGGLTSSGVPDSEAADVQTAWGILIETAVNEYAERNGLL